MATEKERLELELLATDKASTVVDKLAGAVTKLDGETATVDLDADDAASEHVKAVDKLVDQLDGETAEIELSAEDKATAEIEAMREKAERMADEEYEAQLTAQARQLDTTIKNANKLLLQLDGEEAEAILSARDEASAKLSAVSDELTSVRNRTGSVRDEMGRAQDATHSFYGNALSEIPIVGQTFGPLGETVSQMTEGLLAGEISLKEIGKAAGPIAAVSVAMMAVNKALELKKAREEWRTKQVEEYADALKETADVGEAVNQVLRDTRDLSFLLAPSLGQLFGADDSADALEIFTRLGIGVDDVTEAIEGQARVVDGSYSPAFTDLALKMADAGASQEDMAAVTRFLAYEIDATRTATERAGQESQFFAETTDSLTEAYGRLLKQDNPLRSFGGYQQQMWADMADGAIDNADNIDHINRVMEATGLTAEEVLALYHEGYQEAQESAEGLADAIKEHLVTSLEDQAEALEATIEQQEGWIDNQRQMLDVTRSKTEADLEAAEALADYNAITDDTEDAEQKRADALKEVEDSALDAADAAVELAEANATAAGKTLTATGRVDEFNRSLLQQAANAEGPARQSIIRLIAQYNDIPEEEATRIVAQVDQQGISSAMTTLNAVSATRIAAVSTMVNQAALNQTNGQIASVTGDKQVAIRMLADDSKVYEAINRIRNLAAITVALKGVARNAAGNPSFSGGPTTLSEQGDEWVRVPPGLYDLPRGSQVRPSWDPPEQSRGDTYNATYVNNWPAGVDARSVVAAQRRYQRRNGAA